MTPTKELSQFLETSSNHLPSATNITFHPCKSLSVYTLRLSVLIMREQWGWPQPDGSISYYYGGSYEGILDEWFVSGQSLFSNS